VELLVVITIIGMLTALLLPAVQNAREAGRRATCNNNQHQLSIAMQNFESAKQYFPGFINNVGSNPYPVSWVVALFPYLDRRDVYDIWASGEGTTFPQPGLTTPPATPTTTAATRTTDQNTVNYDAYKYFPLLDCPSDPPETRGTGDTWCSYVCNRGLNGTVMRVSGDTPSTSYTAGSTSNNAVVPWDSAANGVCMDAFIQTYYNSSSGVVSQVSRAPARVGMGFISSHDGASTTLLLAESLLTSRSLWGQSQLTTAPTSSGAFLHLTDYPLGSTYTVFYYRPTSTWTSGSMPTSYSSAYATGPSPSNAWTTIDYASVSGTALTLTRSANTSSSANCELDLGFEWGFVPTSYTSGTPKLNDKIRSRHTGGVVVSFCDGHQQFISDSIDVNVFKHLMTPWGANATDPGNLYYPIQGVLDEASY
jgi:prepilin-type processing-associated H-X9-DG protein